MSQRRRRRILEEGATGIAEVLKVEPTGWGNGSAAKEAKITVRITPDAGGEPITVTTKKWLGPANPVFPGISSPVRFEADKPQNWVWDTNRAPSSLGGLGGLGGGTNIVIPRS